MTTLPTLPPAIISQILSHLSPATIFNLLLTSHPLSTLATPTLHIHAAAQKDSLPALHWAASTGHLPLLTHLLTIFPVDLLDSTGNTPLHHAAQSCRSLVTDTLLLHGADITRTTRHGDTALTTACRSPRVDTPAGTATIRILIAHGANVAGAPLREAVLWGAVAAVSVLLDAGASPHATSGDAEPLLFAAARDAGSVDIVKLLLRYGADVDAPNRNGTTAVMVAARSGFLDMVRVLVGCGADLNRVDGLGRTAFGCACEGRNEALVQYLVGCDGLDVTGAELREHGPGYLAVVNGYADALEVLLRRGADAEYVDSQGRSMVHLAVLKGRQQIIHALLAHGVDIETVDKHGSTPLMAAINLEDRAIMAMLLDHQPDRSRDGIEPLEFAVRIGADGMVDMLLERGTDVNVVGRDGLTVRGRAERDGQSDVVEMMAMSGGL